MTGFNKERYAELLDELSQTETLAATALDPSEVAAHTTKLGVIHARLAALHLEQVSPGFQPPELFGEFCRLTVLGTVEVIGVRSNQKNETEALITQRAADEKYWPLLVHVAGSTVLATDPVANYHDFSGVVNRILTNPKELNNSVDVVNNTLHLLEVRRSDGDRGHEMSPIFWAEVGLTDEERLAAARGRFVTRAAMAEISPEHLYDVHRDQLHRAMNAFEAPPLTYPPDSYILDYQI
jgi:hypothetical protein